MKLRVFAVAILATLTCSTPAQVVIMRGDANCDGEINNFDIDFYLSGIVHYFDALAPADYTQIGGLQECWDDRFTWGDANGDGLFNNFDIDPFVSCILNHTVRAGGGCGIKRGKVETIVTPATGRSFLVYIPDDFDPATDPVLVSIPGTVTTPAQEMGPHTIPGYPDDWPDCGGPNWPALAEDRAHYEPFAVVVPEVLFGGSSATICNTLKDEQHLSASLQYLLDFGEITENGRWCMTGWSSGASFGFTYALHHWDRFQKVHIRYSSIDDIDTWNYTLNIVPNCLDASECTWDGTNWNANPDWWATCTGAYNWHFNENLQLVRIRIVNNSAEVYAAAVTSMLADLALETPPFTLIDQVVYPSLGDTQSCSAGPYGGHYEARELAADFLVGWPD